MVRPSNLELCQVTASGMILRDRTHSTLFIAAIAASEAESSEKRTNPKPRLRPVSLSLTTICVRVSEWASAGSF